MYITFIFYAFLNLSNVFKLVTIVVGTVGTFSLSQINGGINVALFRRRANNFKESMFFILTIVIMKHDINSNK